MIEFLALPQKAIPLPADFRPSPDDVLCGRGRQYYTHPGNAKFRQLVESSLSKYKEAQTKHARSVIVLSIVDEIRQASPSGGFVKFEGGVWFEIGDEAAREKTGQTIREAIIFESPEKRAAKRVKRAENKQKRRQKKLQADAQAKKELARSMAMPAMVSSHNPEHQPAAELSQRRLVTLQPTPSSLASPVAKNQDSSLQLAGRPSMYAHALPSVLANSQAMSLNMGLGMLPGMMGNPFLSSLSTERLAASLALGRQPVAPVGRSMIDIQNSLLMADLARQAAGQQSMRDAALLAHYQAQYPRPDQQK